MTMTTQTFEEFWRANLEKYRALAQADYNHRTAGGWCASVSIDSDDDFLLDIDHDFTLYAASETELVAKLVEKLKNAGFKYAKNWSIVDGSGKKTSGEYSTAWTGLRNEAIEQLNRGETYITFGGNQTIEISIAET